MLCSVYMEGQVLKSIVRVHFSLWTCENCVFSAALLFSLCLEYNVQLVLKNFGGVNLNMKQQYHIQIKFRRCRKNSYNADYNFTFIYSD